MKDSYINNPFDMKVKEKLQNMEVTPPPGVWDALDSRLDAQPASSGMKRYALLLLIPVFALIGTGVYYWQFATPDGAVEMTASPESPAYETLTNDAVTAMPENKEAVVESAVIASEITPPAQPASTGIASSSPAHSNVQASPPVVSNASGTIVRNPAPAQSSSRATSTQIEERLQSEVLLYKMPNRFVLLKLRMVDWEEDYPDEKVSVLKQPKYRPRLGWSVEIAFAPAITHRFLEESNVPSEEIPNQNQIADHKLIEYRNDMESSGFGYSFDFKVGKRLSENWKVRSGVSYIRMGNRVQKTDEFSPPQTLSNDSMVVLHVEQNMTQGAASRNYTSGAYELHNNEYIFVAVPVTVQYEKGFAKWRFYMGAGASVDYLIRTKTEILDNYSWPIGNDRRLSELPRLNYSMILNAGVGYEVLPHLTLTGEPTYRVALRSILPEGSSLQQYPYMLGFSTGLKYEF